MQVRGTFPELNAGQKSPRRNGRYTPADKGVTGFAVSGRTRTVKSAPKTFAGRRAASHNKAHGR